MGAWIETDYAKQYYASLSVAPLVGAWIETFAPKIIRVISLSHPSWVRGLKPYPSEQEFEDTAVAPLVGAWIETSSNTATGTRA